MLLPALYLLWPSISNLVLLLAAMSLAGAVLVFPGKDTIDWGSPFLTKPPFVSGLGPVYIAWVVMPLVSFVCAALLMLSVRSIFRKEDPFHQLVWVRPTPLLMSDALLSGCIIRAAASLHSMSHFLHRAWHSCCSYKHILCSTTLARYSLACK